MNAEEPVPLNLQVWNARRCAEHLGITSKFFMRVVRYSEGFPPPLKNFNQYRPRWSAKMVIDWALEGAMRG